MGDDGGPGDPAQMRARLDHPGRPPGAVGNQAATIALAVIVGQLFQGLDPTLRREPRQTVNPSPRATSAMNSPSRLGLAISTTGGNWSA